MTPMKAPSFAKILLLLLPAFPAIAQMPRDIKPGSVTQKDTLQQVIASRTADYETSKDAKNGSVVFKGIFSYRDMAQEPTFEWLPKGMDEYSPRSRSVSYLSEHLKGHKLLIFLGTWCGDSKDVVPKLYKVLSESEIAHEDIMLVGMDRAKTTTTTTGTDLKEKYGIRLLPTIIVINDRGEEVGRITESVHKTVEQDLVAILKAE